MTLQEFLKDNPAAKVEYDQALASAVAETREKVMAEFKTRSDAAGKVLTSEVYPKACKDLALRVVSGDASVEALTATITAIDSQVEMGTLQAASGEQPEETPAAGGNANTDHQNVQDADSMEAAVARNRSLMGMGGE